MLHIKFRGNGHAGSGEDDFRRVFTIYMYGRGRHLGHVTRMPRTYFSFTLPKEAPHKIWL